MGLRVVSSGSDFVLVPINIILEAIIQSGESNAALVATGPATY